MAQVRALVRKLVLEEFLTGFGKVALSRGDLTEVEWRILRVFLPVERKPGKRRSIKSSTDFRCQTSPQSPTRESKAAEFGESSRGSIPSTYTTTPLRFCS
jgi:hypothetical protein